MLSSFRSSYSWRNRNRDILFLAISFGLQTLFYVFGLVHSLAPSFLIFLLCILLLVSLFTFFFSFSLQLLRIFCTTTLFFSSERWSLSLAKGFDGPRSPRKRAGVLSHAIEKRKNTRRKDCQTCFETGLKPLVPLFGNPLLLDHIIAAKRGSLCLWDAESNFG